MARILIADDEAAIRTLLSYPLEQDGHEVVLAEDGREAIDRHAEGCYDLVVLDVMMPRIDGLAVCRRIRARSTVPIIMLTAKADELDKVLGLEIGADDYITKPFSLREFRSRVRALLRRQAMTAAPAAQQQSLVRIHELELDIVKRRVELRGAPVVLTFIEFELLRVLAAEPGRVFDREQLLTRIWGDAAYRDPRTIDVHIRHLREKIETDAKAPEYLFTVRGAGYRFRDMVA